MKRNISLMLFSFILIAFVSSCIKEGTEPLGDAGKTFLKFNDGPSKSLFYSPFNDIKDVNIFNLRRDASSGAELSKAVSITVELDNQLITDYNTEHGTAYEPLPADFFTYELDEGVTRNANQFTFNFASGDFAKNVNIQLDGSKWSDLSKIYAFAFKITNDAGINRTVEKDTMITFLSIKNEWDGIYSVESGTVTRYTSPGVPANDVLSGSLVGNPDVILATVGPYTLSVPPSGTTGTIQWANGNNSSVGGINGLTFTIDPATNLVTAASASNLTLTNWAGHENKYDPATKTFYLAFRWNPSGATREYEIVLKYKKPRE